MHFAFDQSRALRHQGLEFRALDAPARTGGFIQIAEQTLRGELHRRQRVFDFVGDALGHFLPSGGTLGAEQFGNVVNHHHEAGIGAAWAE